MSWHERPIGSRLQKQYKLPELWRCGGEIQYRQLSNIKPCAGTIVEGLTLECTCGSGMENYAHKGSRQGGGKWGRGGAEVMPNDFVNSGKKSDQFTRDQSATTDRLHYTWDAPSMPGVETWASKGARPKTKHVDCSGNDRNKQTFVQDTGEMADPRDLHERGTILEIDDTRQVVPVEPEITDANTVHSSDRNKGGPRSDDIDKCFEIGRELGDGSLPLDEDVGAITHDDTSVIVEDLDSPVVRKRFPRERYVSFWDVFARQHWRNTQYQLTSMVGRSAWRRCKKREADPFDETTWKINKNDSKEERMRKYKYFGM